MQTAALGRSQRSDRYQTNALSEVGGEPERVMSDNATYQELSGTAGFYGLRILFAEAEALLQFEHAGIQPLVMQHFCEIHGPFGEERDAHPVR